MARRFRPAGAVGKVGRLLTRQQGVAVATGNQTVPVGLATETDTAIGLALALQVGIPSTTDTALTPVAMAIQTVRLDGTNDWYEKAAEPTGVTDGQAGTWSQGFTLEGGDGVLQTFLWVGSGADYGLKIERLANNKIAAEARQLDNTVVFTVTSTSTFTADATKHHLRLQWSGTAATLTIDGTDETNNVAGTLGDVDLTSKWVIGRSDDSANRNYLNASIGEVWFDDSSVTDNNEFWDDTNSLFRDIGTDGSNPTGAAPPLYLNNAFGAFHTNKGGGGNFTLNGAVESGSSFGAYGDVAFALAGVTLASATLDWLDAPSTNMGASSDDMALSVWIRRTTTGAETVYAPDNPGRWNISFQSDDEVQVEWNDNAGTAVLRHVTTGFTIADTNWHHYMAAFHNTTSTGGAATSELYIDGVDRSNVTVNTIGASQFAPSSRGHDIGDNFAGDLSQFWVDDANVDLTIAANREKFYNAGAVDFGSDGSIPTGAQPFLYLRFVSGSLGANDGTGSNFTLTGTVVSSSTSPTD